MNPNFNLAWVLFVMTWILVSCAESERNECGYVDLGQDMDPVVREYLDGTGLGPVDRVASCKIGDYLIYVSEKPGDKTMMLSREGSTIAWVDSSGDISLFENENSVLQLSDDNADGRFDSLNYTVHDETEAGPLYVFDNDFDGQADMKTRATGSGVQGWLWFDGEWREVDWFNAPEPNRILVDGTWHLYEIVDNEVVLSNEE